VDSTKNEAGSRAPEAAARTGSTAPAVPERYEEIVSRLGQIVERLEGGGLSLEEAIAAFEQGIQLARAGASRLDAAERRVEVLLEGDKTEPFEPSRSEAPPPNRNNATASRAKRTAGEDIPF
jgi:exodeoxyribonuclease VII small subunit